MKLPHMLSKHFVTSTLSRPGSLLAEVLARITFCLQCSLIFYVFSSVLLIRWTENYAALVLLVHRSDVPLSWTENYWTIVHSPTNK